MNDIKGIKSWNEDDRPREKLLQKGASSLSDAELIAILIASGTKDKSALDLAREILAKAHNNLSQLGKLTIQEMQKTKGIGEARAITITAAMELGRRRQLNEGIDRAVISRSKDAAGVFIPLLQDLDHEVFCILYLTQSSRLIRHEIISAGGISSTIVDVRMILKNCILNNATIIVVGHNHPGGSTKPSPEDIAITAKLLQAAALMDVRVKDHLIISGNNYLSMADEGYLNA